MKVFAFAAVLLLASCQAPLRQLHAETLEQANKRCLRLADKTKGHWTRGAKVWGRCMEKAGYPDACGNGLECE